MFVENQDTHENATQKVESLSRGYDNFNTLVEEKI